MAAPNSAEVSPISNGKESFSPILDSDACLDHHQKI